MKKAGEMINSLALVTTSGSSVNLIEMNGDDNLAGRHVSVATWWVWLKWGKPGTNLKGKNLLPKR